MRAIWIRSVRPVGFRMGRRWYPMFWEGGLVDPVTATRQWLEYESPGLSVDEGAFVAMRDHVRRQVADPFEVRVVVYWRCDRCGHEFTTRHDPDLPEGGFELRPQIGEREFWRRYYGVDTLSEFQARLLRISTSTPEDETPSEEG